MGELIAGLVDIIKLCWKKIKEWVKKVWEITKSWFKGFINNMLEDENVEKIMVLTGECLKKAMNEATEKTVNEFFDDDIITVPIDEFDEIDMDNININRGEAYVDDDILKRAEKPIILTN